MYDVCKTLKKLEDFEKSCPEARTAVAAKLFREIRWHLNDTLMSYCRQEAVYRLNEAGFHSPSNELIKEATMALYTNDQFIDSEVAENTIDAVISDHGIHLSDMLDEDEVVVDYTIPSCYVAYHCIMPRTGTDLGGALEDTLHRILDVGGDEEDVRKIMGAVIPEIPEEAGEGDVVGEWLEETYPDGYIDLDLGYLIPGCILSMKKEHRRKERCYVK